MNQVSSGFRYFFRHSTDAGLQLDDLVDEQEGVPVGDDLFDLLQI